MHRRLAFAGVALGVFDFAWAAAVAVLIARGDVHAWLCWGGPVSIGAGLLAWCDAARLWRLAQNAERAAGTTPTTLTRPHVPLSFPAKARAPFHRSADLLARDDR